MQNGVQRGEEDLCREPKMVAALSFIHPVNDLLIPNIQAKPRTTVNPNIHLDTNSMSDPN